MTETHAMQVKTEQNCSKNSRKYANRRFRPIGVEPSTPTVEKQNTVESNEGKKLSNIR
jgi:hypothetical protein